MTKGRGQIRGSCIQPKPHTLFPQLVLGCPDTATQHWSNSELSIWIVLPKTIPWNSPEQHSIHVHVHTSSYTELHHFLPYSKFIVYFSSFWRRKCHLCPTSVRCTELLHSSLHQRKKTSLTSKPRPDLLQTDELSLGWRGTWCLTVTEEHSHYNTASPESMTRLTRNSVTVKLLSLIQRFKSHIIKWTYSSHYDVEETSAVWGKFKGCFRRQAVFTKELLLSAKKLLSSKTRH